MVEGVLVCVMSHGCWYGFMTIASLRVFLSFFFFCPWGFSKLLWYSLCISDYSRSYLIYATMHSDQTGVLNLSVCLRLLLPRHIDSIIMVNDQTQFTWKIYKENRNKRSTPFMHNELPASIQAEGAYIHEMTRDITEATKQRRTRMDQGIKSKMVYSKHRCPCWYPFS